MKTFLKSHRWLSISLILTFSLFCGLKPISTTAQTKRQPQIRSSPWQERIVNLKRLGRDFQRLDTSAMKERIIENQIPPQLPIKVELRNLDREPMLRNLEVKVTNTSLKPMYCIDLMMMSPEIFSDEGHPIAFHLLYGRSELMSWDEPLRSDDVPLQPGESYILKLPENNLEAFEHRLSKNGLATSNLKLFYLFFSQINFGNQTGYDGASGTAYSPARNERSSANYCGPPDANQKSNLNLSRSTD